MTRLQEGMAKSLIALEKLSITINEPWVIWQTGGHLKKVIKVNKCRTRKQ